ncbi:MAG TPA: pseudouridine synthase [Candidatus Angelobacter sp.]|nr:pseudouridine synthase [Candidatus Angelobacter sp.]
MKCRRFRQGERAGLPGASPALPRTLKMDTIKLSSPATRQFWEIPVLLEDEHLLALDKPAELLTTPDPLATEAPSLMQLLHASIAAGKPWVKDRQLSFLGNAHRLDAGTSGVLLLAKNKPALLALTDAFGTEKPSRKHHVLVRGTPTEAEFEVDAPLGPHPLKGGLMRVDKDEGKKSRTKFEVLEDFPLHGFALLSCEPLTNRMHQIRVHLRHAGLTVVGDELYGGKFLWLSRLKQDYRLKPGREERPLIGRVALHASELSLTHPITNETVRIESELPKDFKVGLKYLRLYSGNAPV